MLYACPCCGYRTLTAAPGAAHELCEVCAWETRDVNDRWSGRDASDLAAAQHSFAEHGVYDATFAGFTRPPRPEEARPAWWTTLEAGPRVVTALVEQAFAGVMLDGGVSLDEAELIDDYALPARTELDPPPRGHGRGPPWQELTRAALDRFPWGNFPFQDARGIRYHLPAFMVAHLRGEPPAALSSLLFVLASGHQLEALHHLLTNVQRHAVARYLAFVSDSSEWYAGSAADALRGCWAANLDPDQRAHVAKL
jgi:Cysteine-rich CPCC